MTNHPMPGGPYLHTILTLWNVGAPAAVYRGMEQTGMHRWRTLQKPDDGQVVILFALFSLVLVGILALAVDTGYLLSERRETQAAVDAASLAGAVAMLNGASDDEIEATVDSYLLANGVDPAEATVHTVTPTGDENEGEVYVEIQRPVQRFFLGAVYTGPWETSAQATSAIESGQPTNVALFAMDEEDDPIAITGNSDIDIIDGGAMSNGDVSCTGNGGLEADATVNAHGEFDESPNCDVTGDQGKNENAPIMEDPLADVPPPSRPEEPSSPGGSNASCDSSDGGTTWICPEGRYTSGLNVSGNNKSVTFTGSSYHFASGTDVELSGNDMNVMFGTSGGNNIFYFDGGDLKLTGNNPTATFWPGTYYFGDGGELRLTGNNPTLEFMPGNYTFYMDGSDFRFSGNNLGLFAPASDVNFYFEDANFIAGGNTDTTLPPGTYHFNNGNFEMNGNITITGEDVFFYLENGASWRTNGNLNYRLTASDTALYEGMLPNMLFYSDRANESTFDIIGNSSTLLTGVVYLPAIDFEITGNANGVWAQGQVIVNTFTTTGNIEIDLDYRDFVDFRVPAVYLVE